MVQWWWWGGETQEEIVDEKVKEKTENLIKVLPAEFMRDVDHESKLAITDGLYIFMSIWKGKRDKTIEEIYKEIVSKQGNNTIFKAFKSLFKLKRSISHTIALQLTLWQKKWFHEWQKKWFPKEHCSSGNTKLEVSYLTCPGWSIQLCPPLCYVWWKYLLNFIQITYKR